MHVTETALRASIFIGEDDTWRHTPRYHEIVRRAREAGLAGATVLRGMEGYGTHSLIHTTRLLDLAEDLPVVVIIIDTEERVRGFVPALDELVPEGAVILDEVEVVRFTGEERP